MKDLDDLELDGGDDGHDDEPSARELDVPAGELDVPAGAEDDAAGGPTDFQAVEEGEELPPDLTSERPAIPVLWPLLLLVLGVPVALYLLFRPGAEVVAPPESAPAPTALPAATPAPEPTAEPTPDLELPPLEESDAAVRELAAGVSPHPAYARWLGREGLVRRFVVVVENVADGENPKGHLDFLAPEEPFPAAGAGREPFLDPRGYDRYDSIAATVDSVDAEAATALYRSLKPLIDEAYRELGHPAGSFDETLQRAIDKLLAVPKREGRIDLRRLSANYAFADPQLEALEPAQKQLLRMGPDNQGKLQRKLRQIREALAKPAGEAAVPATAGEARDGQPPS